MEPKSIQNGLQSGFGRAWMEDSDSKRKKVRVKSIPGALTEHKQEVFATSGGGKLGGGKWLHTLDDRVQGQGVGAPLRGSLKGP